MTSKQQMHSLEQFLAQAQGPSVSWADVDDDLEMYPNIEEPPSTDRHDHAEPAASSRQSRQTRVPILPRSPPFIIYCGNLSFNCTEQNLVEFFAPLKVREVRFAIDPQSKRPKGFGYVEFHSRDDMERAFERKAELLLNRPIRIDVQSSRHHENGGGDHHRPQRQHTAPPMHQSGPPAERQKLALQPRSVDPNKPSDTVTTQPKANPFGAARPREEVLKEKAKAAAATAPSSEAIAAPIQTSTAEKRSVSPSVQGRSNSAIVSTRTYQQRPAWGPVQSVLSPHAAVTAASDPSNTPSASSFQRQAWGSRGTTPRSNPDRTLAENQGAHRPNDRHFDMKQSGPNRHGPAPHGAGAHDRRGPPVRHPDHERRTGPRPGPHPNHGPDAKTGSYEPPHQDHRRPRHPHHHHHHHHRRDDERKASREKSDIIAAKPADTGAGTTAAADRQSRADRPRSPSPSHADGRVASSNVDDAGFEMPRKGRRNGSGRSSVSAVTSSIAKTDLNANSNSNRKEKNVSGATTSGRSWASRVQGSAHTDIPSSVSYSSNMFSSLATDDD